ncbi:di-trans,poly-cis-decaprenylcistransferase [Treponema ruminis]|uniref:Isoprenyl transferase n=1 Tax=Treponema ruminis TaxID=744515 RepID=A0A7W8G797_9SPIR|nr:polyprenyl diphosphate synthase [Treponema ruminis]MBB5225187.1 undecaprenyl diphosphate synthase [Treponema ruminis]QSI01943.1 di-trans,poly-cis-decaprenylcistransferase [Treponema ruminis]
MTTEEIIARGVPEHVAIIMDGNGRWAKKRGLPRTAGHKEGLTSAKKIVAAAAKLGIKYVTLYTFSTENWKRAQEEVGYLMGLIKGHLRAEFEFYKKNGIRVEHIGNIDGLPEDVKSEIINAKKDTEHFTGTTCVLAINYGSRDEIVRGVKKIIASGTGADSVTEDLISQSLDIPSLPPVDLMIRTGGEERLSNFLLWQCAYAEFIFTDTLWPDYNEEEFFDDVAKYQQRNRRFGAVPNQ